MAGGAVGFFTGDIKHLSDDMKALKPTVSPTVPRLLNRIYDKAMTAASGNVVKRLLLKMALSSKETDIRR